ncbi:MAG: hypothetical protein QOF75_2894 [Gaiellaceae bacterium]|nr:hypothetical protein [Gaiellaceae bacterium]
MARGDPKGGRPGAPQGGEPGPATPLRFFDLAQTLCQHDVAFVLIGGFAVTLHGYIRATKDVDIVPDPEPANLSRLWDALSTLNARPADFGEFESQELPVPFTREGFVVSGGGNWVIYTVIYTTLGRVDVMPYVESADGEMIYDDLRENAVRVDLDEVGFPIWVASTADLIAMKEHANRDIDRIDLTALRMAQGEET